MSINIDLGSDVLNEASWKLLDKIQEYQQVDAPLWNNFKGCLKEAIEVYLTEIFEEKLK
jgi:hypothetical protein